MKTFVLWILFVGLIWFTNAKSIKETINASKEDQVQGTGLFQNKTNNSSEVLHVKQVETSITKPSSRKKRHAAHLPWRKDEFTYSILKYTRDMPAHVQERVFGMAFNLWHKAAPQLKFEFKQNDPNADFKIAFVKGAHGDSKPFDGKGPLIAHVFYPEDGRMHFDDDEWFTDGSRKGINLLSAAVHEVGHALGLGHSKVKSSVMYKLYRKYKGKNIELDSGDIKAIKKLYHIRPNDRGGLNCQDKDRRTCVQYKEEGYCQFTDIMKKFCRFTCNLCNS